MEGKRLATERSASEQAAFRRNSRRWYSALAIAVLLIVTTGLIVGIAYDTHATASAKFQHIEVAIGIVGIAFAVVTGFGRSIYMVIKGVRDLRRMP